MMAYQYANIKNYLHGIAFKGRLAYGRGKEALLDKAKIVRIRIAAVQRAPDLKEKQQCREYHRQSLRDPAGFA
jgi:hypothetical protein